MQKSCATSVYATAYKPPKRVYVMAMKVDTMMAVLFFMSIITASVDPVVEERLCIVEKLYNVDRLCILGKSCAL